MNVSGHLCLAIGSALIGFVSYRSRQWLLGLAALLIYGLGMRLLCEVPR